MDLARETDFASIGESLDTRCDVHALSEIVEPIVEGNGNRRTTMQAYLEDEIRLGPCCIKASNLRAHRQRGLRGIRRVMNAAITASPNVFIIAPLWRTATSVSRSKCCCTSANALRSPMRS